MQSTLADTPNSTIRQTDQDVLNWLRLARVELAAAKLNALLDTYGDDPGALLSAGSAAWAAGGLNPGQIKRMEECAAGDADQILTPFHRCGAHIVTRRGAFSEQYPQALRDLPGAPPILHVRGRLMADDRFSVAIVGSRRATNYGLAIAERFSRELCAHGLCIVSGGARGVDTRAHRGALAAGGRTVAFVGCGLDIPYPAENRALFDEIVDGGHGAIVSEYPFGANPEPWRFPGRNRLIAGMSLGTLVIESDVTSGAMITASDAASAGRDVFAVPGSIESGRSSGCHRLIQEGCEAHSIVSRHPARTWDSATHRRSDGSVPREQAWSPRPGTKPFAAGRHASHQHPCRQSQPASRRARHS